MSTEKIDFLDEEGNCKDNQQQQGLPLIERNNADHDNTEAGQVVATTELQKKQEEQDDMTIIAKETKARKRNKISPIKETDQHAAAALEDRVSSNSATELLEVTKTGDGDGGEVLPKKSPKKTDQIVEKIHVVEEKINSFFQREWQAFKSEKQKKLRQIPKKITTRSSTLSSTSGETGWTRTQIEKIQQIREKSMNVSISQLTIRVY